MNATCNKNAGHFILQMKRIIDPFRVFDFAMLDGFKTSPMTWFQSTNEMLISWAGQIASWNGFVMVAFSCTSQKYPSQNWF